MEQLLRHLTARDLITLGVGNVIGSGIFILFASIFKRAKSHTFLALLIASIPNIIAALTYSELSSLYESNSMEYESVKDAFNEFTASVSIYILLGFIIFNTATVVLFAGSILGIDNVKFVFALVVLFILSIINFLGIDVSKKITNTIGLTEIVTLVTIIMTGIRTWKPSAFQLLPPTANSAQASFKVASFLSLFLYSGYDSVVKLSEETINPGTNIPLGVLGSVLIPTFIYVFMGATAASQPDQKAIANSKAPITEIVKQLFQSDLVAHFVTAVGIAIVLNTFFIGVISLSRFIYGLSKHHKLPQQLTVVNERFHTPGNAIVATFVFLGIALLIDSGEKCAYYANLFFLLFLILLQMSLLILRFKREKDVREFTVPLNIGKISMLNIVGIAFCLYYIYIVLFPRSCGGALVQFLLDHLFEFFFRYLLIRSIIYGPIL
jgi:basic amino acid/polyamine antiporter, APA family